MEVGLRKRSTAALFLLKTKQELASTTTGPSCSSSEEDLHLQDAAVMEESESAAAAPATSTSTCIKNTRSRSSSSSRSSSFWHFIVVVVVVVLHLIAIAIFIAGFVLRIQLHTGEECDMTYSVREFLEVETPHFQSPSAATRDYKLYKFVDRRDPRYQPLLAGLVQAQQPSPLKGDEHCLGGSAASAAASNNNSNVTRKNIVLYIPGHWGSHSQSRSVGAHGIQMTGQRQSSRLAQQALATNIWTGDAPDINQFVYDVYSVDFAEQGGGLHGRFLELQSDFVASVVQQLASACQVDSITLVAHSMGGYAARLTPIRHPHTSQLVSNIITLATPHSNPLYAFDKSVHDVHQQLLQTVQNNNISTTLLVTISGGLRDEMIEPAVCQVNSNHPASSSFSILSPQLLLERGALGMDHRAIVWCHGVLHQVRIVIWALARSKDKNVKERRRSIEKVFGKESYQEDLEKLATTFRTTYGHWKASSMESAMLYNLPILFELFVVIAGLRCAFPETIFSPAFPLAAIMCGWIWCDISKEAVVTLSLVANTVNVILVQMIPLGFLKTKNPVRLAIGLSVGVLLVTLVLGLFVGSHPWSTRHLGCSLYIYSILVMYLCLFLLVGLDKQSPIGKQKVAFTALVGLSIPPMVAGPITLMAWEQEIQRSSWYALLSVLVPICTSCWRNSTTTNHDTPGLGVWKRIRALLVTVAVIAVCPDILSRGSGFRVAGFVASVAWIDIAVDILAYAVKF